MRVALSAIRFLEAAAKLAEFAIAKDHSRVSLLSKKMPDSLSFITCTELAVGGAGT